MHPQYRVVVTGVNSDRGGGNRQFLKCTKYLVDARVRSGNESESAQHQRDAVHRQPPGEEVVPVAAIVGTAGNGHVAKRWEDQCQERAGHGAQHRYEQAQVWYHVGRDNCNTRGYI